LFELKANNIFPIVVNVSVLLTITHVLNSMPLFCFVIIVVLVKIVIIWPGVNANGNIIYCIIIMYL
jgi:hypothetical protein